MDEGEDRSEDGAKNRECSWEIGHTRVGEVDAENAKEIGKEKRTHASRRLDPKSRSLGSPSLHILGWLSRFTLTNF